MAKPSSLLQRARGLLHARDGALTRQLHREPARFGLGQLPADRLPDATTTMVCGFCSTGCGLNVHLRDGLAIGLSPSSTHSVNLGMACPKGWEALAPLSSPNRATVPLRRNEDGSQVETTWEEALRLFSSRMREVQTEHGPQAAAFLSTGQIPSEEMAFLGALTKFGMGMLHGDGNTRQCMATAARAYKESFGFDAPPYTYADFEASDVLVFVGANPCIAHPIMWERVCLNRNNPQIIVVDPRRTETAQAATLHVPAEPKSDLALLYAVAHVLIRDGAIDTEFIAEHTEGFDEFEAHVESYSPTAVAEGCGLPEETIETMAALIANGKRVSFWWTMGVNQSHQGVRTAQAIINLALMTGNIGRPGTGANSITGQCNAMGSRLFSHTTGLPGGRAFDVPEDRQVVARAFGIEESRIPDNPGWCYDQILEGILSGEIRALWIIATNTAHSWINQSDVREILERLDFLVVQDMYANTDTAQLADLVLPAAGWGEKEGTFINSERRIGLIKQVQRAPGQALSDFRIFSLIADAMGLGAMFANWDSPESVFRMLQECTQGTPCDIGGIEGYAALEGAQGIQWPYRSGDSRDTDHERRLFADGQFFTRSGRARFIGDEPRPMPEEPREDFPLLLLTGRGSSTQWHTQTRTSQSPVLKKLSPQDLYVEINPVDAHSLGVQPDEWVTVRSQRGNARARAFVTPVVKVGQVFMPMHYKETNQLTLAAFDPHSRQPAYKGCAVSLARATAGS